MATNKISFALVFLALVIGLVVAQQTLGIQIEQIISQFDFLGGAPGFIDHSRELAGILVWSG